MRPVSDFPSFARRTVQTASSTADSPGVDSKRCTSMATRKSASALSVCGNSVTRGVPSSATRFSATTRAILSPSGDAQRLNSSSATWFGPVLTTICGRSTAAGTETGPTASERLDDVVAGVAVPLSV